MRLSQVLLVLCLALFIFALAGCGGDAVSPASNTPTTPTTTPTTPTPTGGTPTPPTGGTPTAPAPTPTPTPAPSAVASTSPKSGDTCVSQNPDVKVTFTSGSAPSNVTTDNFKVAGPFGDEDGQVTWDAASNTATWITRPVSTRETRGPDLGMLSNYTATISGFNGGPYSFTFQTGPCGAIYAANTQLYDLPGSQSTSIYGINDNGVMVGDYSAGGTGGLGFMVANGQVTQLKGTGYKINNNNAVVGYYLISGWQVGYLYQNGQYTDIRDPNTNPVSTTSTFPQDQNWAYGINNLGVIVGYYVPNHTGQFPVSSGFIRQPDGSYSDIQKVPHDINSSGHVVGWAGNSSWMYNGAYTDLAVPGCGNVTVWGNNDADDSTGYAVCSSWQNGKGAYVMRGGTVTQVAVAGCRYVSAYDINNNGVVVGVCSSRTGDHGFIATPK